MELSSTRHRPELSEIETWIERAQAPGGETSVFATDLASLSKPEQLEFLPLTCLVLAKRDASRAVELKAHYLTTFCASSLPEASRVGVDVFGGGAHESASRFLRSHSNQAFILVASPTELEICQAAVVETMEVDTLSPLGGRWTLAPLSRERIQLLKFDCLASLREGALCGILLGICLGAIEELGRFLRERRQGGRSIIGWSAVRQEFLAIEEGVRGLEEVFFQLVSGARLPTYASQARTLRMRLLRAGPELTSRSLQLMGGAGYMHDYLMARRFEQIHLILALLGSPDETELLPGVKP